MKKRVLSMLLAFILCFSTLPMTAFAQEADAVTEQEEQQETDSAEEQKEAEAAEAPGEETSSDKSTTAEAPGTGDPIAGEVPDTVKPTVDSVSDSDAGTQDTGADDEKKAAVQKVQALIDALPETVTVENAESVSAQLEAIDEAMESLTEEQIAELDMTRLHAISEAMNALMMVAEGEHTHCICGKEHHDIGDHKADSQVTFMKLWMDNGELKIDEDAVGKKTNIAGYSGECYVLPSGNYYLDSNLTLSCPIYIGQEVNQDTNAKVVNLCLNGKSITAAGDFDTIILYRGNSTMDMTLSLTDCQGTGKITHEATKTGCGVYVCGLHNAIFNMYGGSITGNKEHVSSSNNTRTETPGGGGVYMNCPTNEQAYGGIFNMYGGTISNNSATNGGGLFMCNNVGNNFNMYDGSITGNTATEKGGGVYSAGGEITMTGGNIERNNASQGGGMYESGGSSVFFTMSGGSITGNTATGKGGGVYVSTGGNFKISGSVQITGNTKESAVNNVELAAGKTITIQSGLADGASIGVTTEKTPGIGDYSKVASSAEGYYLTEADANHFFSDVNKTTYTIKLADNKLILTNTGDGTLHSHPICGATCTHKNADGTFQHKAVYWEATSTLTNDMPAGYYYLTSDVTLTQSWNPAYGMVLDLNGFNINMDANRNVIEKSTEGPFTLTDCMGQKNVYGKITHVNNHKGGGIELFYSYKSSFVMYGGSITENTGDYPGVCLAYNRNNRPRTFTMYGGEITNNKNTNTTGSYKGGGVYVAVGNTFTMTGGKITGNQTATDGGGVYVDKGTKQGNFIVSGDARITENHKGDGSLDNVYLKSDANGTQKQAYIQVKGALSNNASIGVNAGTIDAGSYKIVAKGSQYTLTDDDRQHFTSDVAGYTPKLVDNSIAFTNGTLHEHKICGKTDCNDDHSDALWIPLTYDTTAKTLKYGATETTRAQRTNPTEHYVYTLPAGNYYLAEDITLEGSISISGDVNICLDGHTISTNKYCYGVFYFADYKLTVCDCENKGKILVANTGDMKSVAVQISKSNASFDLYGGTISGGYVGVSTNVPVRLYGGTITGNTRGVKLYDTTLTIGGDAKVIGNTEANVLLENTQTITIANSLTEYAKIGITTSTAPTEDQSVLFATGAAKTDLDYSKIFIPDVKNRNYIVSKGEGGNLYLGIHQHNWKATAKGAQITFKCNATGCNLGSDFATTYTVTAPTDLTYSGSEKVATVTTDDKYFDGLGLPTTAITYQELKATGNVGIEGAPKNAGTYRATLKITNSDNTTATATLDYAITKAPLTVTANDNEITYGDSPNNKSVSYSGFVNNEKADVLQGTLNYTYNYKQYDNVGDNYTITPSGQTSDNYAITYVPGQLKVTPLTAELKWENTENRTYGDNKGNVTAKVINLVNNDVIDVTVSGGDTLTAGTHTATATGLTGDKAGNYKLPVNVTREYEIGFMAQKLTFATSGDVTKTYGDDTFANAATNDRADGSKVTYSSSDPFVAEVDADGKVTIKGAGTAIITASAQKVEGKYSVGNAEYTLIVNRKELTAEDLEFTTDALITKKYDGTIDCTTATVKMKDSAIVNADDMVPTVTGTYAYNSANVNDAKTVTFTSKETITRNYILPAGLTVKHAASISKADQAPITITSTSATYGTDLTLTVDGGSGNGALTYTVGNGTGAATISGSTLRPVRAGQVTVTVKKSGGDNYNDVTSLAKVITINKAIYSSPVSKTVNIIKNRVGEQTGTLTVADFFPEGQVPASAQIIVTATPPSGIVTVTTYWDTYKGYILTYIAQDNITSTSDQTCAVTISSANYENIEATLIFHPTDKTTVTIEGLTYTDKTYDGSAIQPTGTLLVTGGNVPANELEVLYEGTSANGTNYSSSSAPKDAGTYKVTYKVADSNENYTGSVEYTFTISPKNVTAGMIDTIAAQEYTGSAITPELVVKDGGVALISGTDFDSKYDNNTNAGENTATVTINGKGNYKGTASRTFTIGPKDIKGAVITLQADSLGYTGLMQEVQITSVTLNQVPLTANDYDIVNNSNKQINADASITLTIAGKGNYTGTATTTWKITRATPALDNFDVTPDLSQKQTYDGKPKEVTAKTKNGVIDMGNVTVCYEGISGTTYPRRETAPTNAGSYKVILSVAEGKNYTAAEIEAGTLTIEKADLTVEDVTEFFEYTKKGEQTINVSNLVPGARSYALDAYTNDNGIVSGDITIDATGLMKFALSELTKDNIDNKVTVPVTITSENYKDVRVNVIIYISPEYRIIDGANSSWTQNTDGTVVIRGNGEFFRFHAVKVDGKVLDPANYEAKEGSTIITLKAEYLKTLATGSHTFAIVWNNGIAGTNFTVAANTSGNNSGNNSNNNDSNHGSDNSGSNDSGNTAANTAAAPAQELDKVPATGDASGIWLTLFVISLTGLVGMLARRKKN